MQYKPEITYISNGITELELDDFITLAKEMVIAALFREFKEPLAVNLISIVTDG